MLRITSFKARGRTANAGRERPLTAAWARGALGAEGYSAAWEARTRTGGATARAYSNGAADFGFLRDL
jgi:hypothetical protein